MDARILIAVVLIVGINAVSNVVDMAELVADVDCITNAGYSSIIFRGYKSNGQVDPNVKENLLLASEIDCTIYISPCFKCGNPRKQLVDLCETINGTGYKYRPYIAVEDINLWSKSTTENRNFITETVDEVMKQTACFGKPRFRTTKHEWENIVGTDCIAFSDYYLWYISSDNKKDFNDFKPFGGWKKPTAKQYDQDKVVCNNHVNLNIKALVFGDSLKTTMDENGSCCYLN
jgi:hypothetical protein